MAISNHKYKERALVQIGTQVIDQLVASMTDKELQQAGENLKQANLSPTVYKRHTVKGLDVPEYDLKGVKGKFTL